MKQTQQMEIAVGFFFSLSLLALLLLALKVSNLGSFIANDSYQVEAYFSNIGGLKLKSPVKMSGVRVGEVAAIDFDSERYEAKVTLSIKAAFDKIPADSSASIFTSGLLGEQYIGLDVGGDDMFLTEGDQIELTQSAVVLERLIGQFLYQKASE